MGRRYRSGGGTTLRRRRRAGRIEVPRARNPAEGTTNTGTRVTVELCVPLASARQCGQQTLSCSLPRPRGRRRRSWILAQLWAGRASAPLPTTSHVEGKFSRARPRGSSTSFGGTAEEKVKIRLSDGQPPSFLPLRSVK